MSQSFETIFSETDNQGIATITINRPDKLNALNEKVLNELAEVFEQLNASDSVKGILLTGAGDKAFVAGADIKELRDLNERSGRKKSQRVQEVFQRVEDTRKPVIAVVNGYALGGGAELAMACHLRIAGTNAVFGLPEVGLGLIPGYGGTQRLTRLVGRSRALEMILTGSQVKADEAFQMGLVNKVTEHNVMEAARELLKQILKNGPLAIGKAIEAVYHPESENGYRKEAELFGWLCATEDAKEGTTAFLEKRNPQFKGK